MRECKRCGYSEFDRCIDVHHVVYGENEVTLDLCCCCHMAIHRGAITYENGEFREYRVGDVIPRGKRCGPKGPRKKKPVKRGKFDPNKLRERVGLEWIAQNSRNAHYH